MVVYAGTLWRDGEPEGEAWMRAEGGRVAEEGTGPAPEGDAQPAVLLDGMTDLHTHIGDAFLQGRDLPRDLAALVAPQTGLKARQLAAVTPERMRAGMVDHLRALAAHGVTSVLDFREQGVPGLRLAREAARGVGLKVRFLGRPAGTTWEDREVQAVLGEADGLGIPSLTDYGKAACEGLRRAAHAAGKPFALHASEGAREDMEAVLGLEPDLLVHLASATRADLRLVAEEAVPVAVCPSANDFFGLRPPVDAFHAVGLEWFLGTDNAMLGSADPVREAGLLAEWFPSLGPEELLRALTTAPGKVLNQFGPDAVRSPRVRVVPTSDAGIPRWSAAPIVLER